METGYYLNVSVLLCIRSWMLFFNKCTEKNNIMFELVNAPISEGRSMFIWSSWTLEWLLVIFVFWSCCHQVFYLQITSLVN